MGLVIAAVAASLTAFFTGVIGNWFDPAKAADKLASDDAVTIVAVDDRSGAMGMSWPNVITPDQAAQIEAANSDQATYHMMADFGGIPLTTQILSITLEGQRAVPVQITRIRPHVVSCGPSLHDGTFYLTHHEGLNDVPNLRVDFDKKTPEFVDAGRVDAGQPAPPYFDSKTITLQKNELITIQITANVTNQDCKWELELDEIVDSSPVIQIAQGAQPFEITGLAPLDSYGARYLRSYLYTNTDKSHHWSLEPYSWFCQTSCDIAYWRAS